MRAFCFPGGAAVACQVRSMRLAERGEMWMAPGARAIPFTAQMDIDARHSGFRWEARCRGGLRFFTVTDAYRDGHGSLAIRAGILPLRRLEGPDFDRGELQRYLVSFALCPSMLLSNSGLEWSAVQPGRWRVAEGATSVELEFDASGCPVSSHCDRPRTVGNHAVLTPWTGRADGFREWDGIRIAGRTEAWWHLADGPFRYYASEILASRAFFGPTGGS